MAHERAGQPAAPEDLIDVAHVVTAYYTTWPDVEDPGQRVAFGTSGHRGSSLGGYVSVAAASRQDPAKPDWSRLAPIPSGSRAWTISSRQLRRAWGRFNPTPPSAARRGE